MITILICFLYLTGRRTVFAAGIFKTGLQACPACIFSFSKQRKYADTFIGTTSPDAVPSKDLGPVRKKTKSAPD